MCGRFQCRPLVKPAPPRRRAAANSPQPRQQPAPAPTLAAAFTGLVHQLQLDALAMAAGLPPISPLAVQLAGRALTVASIKVIQWAELDPVDLFLLFAPTSFYQL